VLASYSKFFSLVIAFSLISGCSTTHTDNNLPDANAPIENPFGTGANAMWNGNGKSNDDQGSQNITLRTRRGDQSVEVELPQKYDDNLVVPMGQLYSKSAPTVGGAVDNNGIDYQYKDHKATTADREIASTFGANNNPEQENEKREIESQLGLQQSDELPNMDQSYLSKMDVVKQLFKAARYEACLLEIDQLVKTYPTNSRLYEMRGTVLDRLGYQTLAINSWKQALELDPGNLSLKKVIEKREQQRNVASERK
jgi:tetratricopeptide (TPR) repeat protein